MSLLVAGASEVDISPVDSQFLYGYPYVKRYSTGVHDPLMASALYLSDGTTRTIFIGTDLVFVGLPTSKSARRRIAQATGVPMENIMITATHTHSGPSTVRCLVTRRDVPPDPDPAYLKLMEDGIVKAGTQAVAGAGPAEAGLGIADGSTVGGNRHDPQGPSDPQVPVLAVREAGGGRFIAVMTAVSVHPTVLHEDSTLASADYHGPARQYLQRQVVGKGCPIVGHNGASGNQSPRHVVRGQTFAEAIRLGQALGRSIQQALQTITYRRDLPIRVRRAFVDLPLRPFPSLAEATKREKEARQRLERMRQDGSPRADTRTAECDWFGADFAVTFATVNEAGEIPQYLETCQPAEIQVIRVGPWTFVGWPGEEYVEFALAVKSRHANTFILTLANSDLQGYLVTEEAIQRRYYESNNSMFQSPQSGNLMVQKTLELLT